MVKDSCVALIFPEGEIHNETEEIPSTGNRESVWGMLSFRKKDASLKMRPDLDEPLAGHDGEIDRTGDPLINDQSSWTVADQTHSKLIHPRSSRKILAWLFVFALLSGALAGCAGGGGAGKSSTGSTSSSASLIVREVTITSGPQSGGTQIEIVGTGFYGEIQVLVGGMAATGVTVNAAKTKITCFAPSSSTIGPKDIVVVSSTNGSVQSPTPFTYNPPPTITTISPTSGSTAGGTYLTILGTGFEGTVTVFIGDTAATGVAVDGNRTQITCVTPSSSSTGSKTVTVLSSTHGEAISPTNFTYVSPSPPTPPVVNFVSPSSGPLTGGTSLLISGSDFEGTITVTIDNVAASSVVVNASKTQIACLTPAGTSEGPKRVVVTSSVRGSVQAVGAFTYNPVVVVDSVSPTAGPLAGGTKLTLTGDHFGGAITVKIGTQSASSVVVSSDKKTITCTTPAASSSGGRTVSVTSTSNGTGTWGGGQFLYYGPPPIIGSISPTTGPDRGGTKLTIKGGNFQPTISVLVGPARATEVAVSSDLTQITCRTPAGTAGAADVVVGSTSNGTVTASEAFLYNTNPAPTFSTLAPSEGPMAGGTSFTITGANFFGTVSVLFGTQQATNIQVTTDGKTITGQTPKADADGAVSVVIDSSTHGLSTVTKLFTYNPLPTMSLIVPDHGPIFGGTTVNITGTGFDGTVNVTFGNGATSSVTVTDDTLIRTQTPSATSTGLVNVIISSSTHGITTFTDAFRYDPNPLPDITRVTPSEGPAAGLTPVTIEGHNFFGTLRVTFDGQLATNVQASSDGTQLSCLTPATTKTTPLTVDLAILSSTHGLVSKTGAYRYNSPPKLNSVSPISGPAQGGTVLTIAGEGFGGTVNVTIGTVVADVLSVSPSSQIQCRTRPSSVGTKDVIVCSSTHGTSTLTNGFTYNPTPTISAVTPAEGPVAGGTAIVIDGTDFRDTVNVTIGGVLVASPVVSSDKRQISCQTPAGRSVGSKTVEVLSSTHGLASLVNGFTYNTTPTIGLISPSSGPQEGGTLLTITGTGFGGTVNVTIGGVPARDVTLNTSTTITCTTPGSTSWGDVDVTVQSSTNGTAHGAFTYRRTPEITSVTPSSGPQGGGTTIRITGSNFCEALTDTVDVTVGRVAATGVHLVSDVTGVYIECVTANSPDYGLVSVSIRSATHGTATKAEAFTYVPPTPTIATITPNEGPLLETTNITITGQHFENTVNVTIGSLAASNVVVNAGKTQIQCQVPPGVTTGPVPVTVSSSSHGTVTVDNGFRYNPTMIIMGVNPAEGSIDGGTTVTITGTNFVQIDRVTFGTAVATGVTVNGTTTISCVTASSTEGDKDVIVHSSTHGTATKFNGFHYNARPEIYTITPDNGPMAGGTRVVITGTGFTGTVRVLLGTTYGEAQDCTGVAVNSGKTEITCYTPAGSAGVVNVYVLSSSSGVAVLSNGYTYNSPPEVTEIDPNNGPMRGGNRVTINGSNFGRTISDTLNVTIGSGAATDIQVNADRNQIQCTAPSSVVAAPVSVIISSAECGIKVVPNAYTYNPKPTITGVSPISGPQAGGTTVTIVGENFCETVAGTTVNVTFGSVAATSCVLVSPTEIRCVTAPSPGFGPVSVVVDSSTNGTPVVAGTYTYNKTPTITSVTPTTGPAEGGAQVIIVGTDFKNNLTVLFGSRQATNLRSDSTHVTCTTPAGTAGTTVTVTVTSDSNGSAGWSQPGYGYNPIITISGIEPPFGPCQGGTTVRITGTYFVDTLDGTVDVTIGSVPVTNVTITSDHTLITGITSPCLSSGAKDVVVFSHSHGTGRLTNGFTYNTTPTLLSINPNEGPVAGWTTVAISGEDLGDTSRVTVTFGSRTAPVVAYDTTTVTCMSPPGAAVGAVDVTLFSPSNGVASWTNGFTYNPTPTLTAIVPDEGPLVGGTVVGISGTDLGDTSRAAVTFGGRNSPVLAYDTTTVTCLSPAGAAVGAVDVALYTPTNGVTTWPLGFTYNTTPTLSSIVPTQGPVAGGTAVAISGTDLGDTSRTTITFGGRDAPVLSFDTTTVTCRSPAGVALGAVDVVLHSPTNGVTTWPLGFTYNTTPTLSSIVPDNGPVAGGTSVAISGTDLGDTSRATVTFAGRDAPILAYDTTTVTCLSPAGAAVGAVDVALYTPTNGVTTWPSGFTYNTTPTLSSITPDNGPVIGGTVVGVSGTNMGDTSRATVTFGGQIATILAFDTTTVTCRSPAGAAVGPVDVTFHSPTNGVATWLPGFTYNQTPTVTAIVPDEGPLVGGTVVGISGTTLGDTSRITVTFGGQNGSILAYDTTTVTCLSPAGAAIGAVDVVLYSPTNGVTSWPLGFTYNTTPTVTAIVPDEGPVVGGTVVAISGTNLGDTSSTTVTFGGRNAPVLAYDTATVTCQSPAGAVVGAVDVVLYSPTNGITTWPLGFTYNTTPTLSLIVPDNGPVAGGTSVAISGTDLGDTSRATVTFGGRSAPVLAYDTTTVTCLSPAGAAVGTVDVALYTPTNGVTTWPLGFTYNTTPTLSSIAPNSGPVAGGAVVGISGANLGDTSRTTVTFGGRSASVLAYDTMTVTCRSPAGAAVGPVDVVLYSPTNGVTTWPLGFTYNQTPTVTAIVPDEGPLVGGTVVGISGTSLGDTSRTTVTFGGLNATILAYDTTSVTCRSPAGAVVGAVDVVMYSPTNGVTTWPLGFTYNTTPNLSSIIPDEGPLVGGTVVAISGTDLGDTSRATVTFAGRNAPVLAYDTTTVTCQSPPGAAVGPVNVVLYSPTHGLSTWLNGFTYNTTPTFDASVSPDHGPAQGGTEVLISGTGFDGTVNVTIGTVPATVLNVTPTSRILCQTNPSSVGTKNVIVSSSVYGEVTGTNLFTYNQTPTILGIFPGQGAQQGGTTVCITGTSFAGSPVDPYDEVSVTFNGAAATILSLDTTTITCRTPASLTTGNATVTLVSSHSGTTTRDDLFTYLKTPTITSLVPSNGPAEGGNQVIIVGTDFNGVPTVFFGSNPAVVSAWASTRITCTAPAGLSGDTVAVTVTSSTNGTTVTSRDPGLGYTYNSTVTIDSIVPSSGPCQGGTTVTITGTHFDGTVNVTIGGVAATNIGVSPTVITCVTGASEGSGPVNVEIFSSTYGSATRTNGFTYNATPTITVPISPNEGPKAGDTLVTINGSGFNGTVNVTFGSLPANPAYITVISETQLTCLTPTSSVSGTVDLTISSSTNGVATAVNAFTYHDLPTITSITPTAGLTSPGTPIVIVGTGFRPTLSVLVGGAACTLGTCTVTQINCTTPSSTSTGPRDVEVRSTATGSCTVADGFTYNPKFASEQTFRTGTGTTPHAIVVRDFNLDGNPDVAVTNKTGATVSIFLNTTACNAAAASFGTRNDFSVGDTPWGIDSGDFNLDGTPDLAVANMDSDSVSVLLNVTAPGASSPTFTTRLDLTGVSGPRATKVADLNNDGKPDIIVGRWSTDEIHVFLNQTVPGASSPDFSTRSDHNLGVSISGPVSIAGGDINGDGKIDLAVANEDDNTVTVLMNSTSPGATTVTLSTPHVFSVDTNPASVCVRDVNGDGKPDIVTSNTFSSTVSVLINKTPAGDTIPQFETKQDFPVGPTPVSLVLADLNADGRPDFATANSSNSTLSIALNTTTPGVTVTAVGGTTDPSTPNGPKAIDAADFNRDGRLDLVTANSGADSEADCVAVVLSVTPVGTFPANLAEKADCIVGFNPIACGSGDFSRDSRADLVVLNPASEVFIFTNTTTVGPTSTLAFTNATSTPFGGIPVAMAVGQVDFDGLADVVTANDSSNSVSYLLNRSPYPNLSVGGGPISVGSGSLPKGIAIADFNLDGRNDLVITKSGQKLVSVLLNTTAVDFSGDVMSFGTTADFTVKTGPMGVAAADFNGDGWPDLAVVNQGSEQVSILNNLGATDRTTVTFSTEKWFNTGAGPVDVAAIDVNLDGKTDLAIANQTGRSVSILINQTVTGSPTPTFASTDDILKDFPSSPVSLKVADLNGDGKPDLVMTDKGNKVSVFLNTTTPGSSTPSFYTRYEQTTGSQPSGLAVFDANGDGYPDVVTSNSAGGTVSGLRNSTVP